MKFIGFLCVLILLGTSLALPVAGVVPEYHIDEKGVHIRGVGPESPILYDNDWWFDVFDNNYLWAQAHLGNAKLRGNIVTRDMWDHPNYLYSMKVCLQDAEKALRLARASGLKNIPDITRGSGRVLNRPESGRIEDTKPDPTPGSRWIVEEARKASPDRPLVIVAGGPLTTVANALLTEPSVAPNIVVFVISVSQYGYNGKDGWSAYIVAEKAPLVEWATGSFWERNSVFEPEHFEQLPNNPFTEDMRRLIQSDLGQANQLGDGAPLVWMYENRCWSDAEVRKAVWKGPAVDFVKGTPAEVLSIPTSATDLDLCRKEYFRVLDKTF